MAERAEVLAKVQEILIERLDVDPDAITEGAHMRDDLQADSLDLVELIEDELILALPLVPRHEHCPVTLPASAADEGAEDAAAEPAPSPFAALARLKGKGQG